jgi:hypothetical protein
MKPFISFLAVAAILASGLLATGCGSSAPSTAAVATPPKQLTPQQQSSINNRLLKEDQKPDAG